MPRVKRATWKGYPHLIIAKADQRTPLFEDKADYQHYLQKLSQLARDKILIVYAFCLMPHEIRLVVQPQKFSLAKAMQRLHGSHSSKINSKREQRGHVFYGRYRSIVFPIVDLLEVVRSIHLWPVRSGSVRRAEHYPWNSHSLYLSSNSIYAEMINTSFIFNTFFSTSRSPERAFDKFIEEAALQKDNLGINEISPGIGGNGSDVAELLAKANMIPLRKKESSLTQLAKKIQLVLSISSKQLMTPSRRQDLVMARRLLSTAAICDSRKSVNDVAGYLKRDKAQISRLVSQGIDLIERDESFRSLYEAIGGNLHKEM